MEDERSLSTNSFEESGWTMYFDDFFAATNNKNNSHPEDGDYDHDQYHTRSPLISDAASLIAKNSSRDVHGEEALGLPILGSSGQYSSRLSLKKRRTRGGGVMVDNALEDTASSPVHSPKVYDLLSQSHKNTRQQDKMDISLQEKTDSEATELKKRGLCLVPLSMVVNYIG